MGDWGVVDAAKRWKTRPAGNRLAEEIDTALTAGQFNDVNQLTELVGGGRVRVSGVLTNKPGTVRVGGMPAAMGPGNTSFVAYAKAGLGTNYIPVVASDFAGRTATNLYRIVVTNGGVARTLAYDLNGNLVSVVTPVSASAYEWDAADRLASITQTGEGTNLSSSHFEYDGAGRRIRIVEMTNNTIQSDKRFVWEGSELAEERTSAGVMTKRFFGAGEQIGGTNYYFTRDHLGSVREITDSAGNLHARYDYDPYGRRTQTLGTLQADSGFTGHYVHAPTGLHLALYRAYDADTGRWLSRDPIGENGGLNLYTYVGNLPIGRKDSFGLAWYDYLPGIGPGIAQARGEAAIQAQLAERGYGSMQELRLERPASCSGITSGNLNAVQSVANIASGSASLYLAAATSITPTAPGANCARLLLPQGKALGKAGSSEAIREVKGGLAEAQALFDELAAGGKIAEKPTYPGTWVDLPGGGGVGLRTEMSKSPGTAANIDVAVPAIPEVRKIKFNP